MTQIIFHIAAIACIVYTVCRFGLFIHKRMRKNKNIGKHVHVPPPETSGKAEPDTWEDTACTSALKDVINTSSIPAPTATITSPVSKYARISATSVPAVEVTTFPVAVKIAGNVSAANTA